MKSKNQLVIPMVSTHSGLPWAIVNQYASYAFKAPMRFLSILTLSLGLQTPFNFTQSTFSILQNLKIN